MKNNKLNYLILASYVFCLVLTVFLFNVNLAGSAESGVGGKGVEPANPLKPVENGGGKGAVPPNPPKPVENGGGKGVVPPNPSKHTSSKSTKIHPQLEIRTSINNIEYISANRSESVEICYNITCLNYPARNIEVMIKVPPVLNNIVLKSENMMWKGESIELKYNNLKVNDSVCFIYKADVALNSPNNYELPFDYKTIESITCASEQKDFKIASIAKLYIKNGIPSKPIITVEREHLRDSNINDSKYNIFLDDYISISCESSDLEDDILTYKLYYTNGKNLTEDLPVIDTKIAPRAEFILSEYDNILSPGINRFAIMGLDTENGFSEYQEIIVDVLDKTYEEYFSEKYGFYLLVMTLVFIIGILVKGIFKRWYLPIIAIFAFSIIWIIAPKYIDQKFLIVPYYEISLYIVLFIYSGYFIESTSLKKNNQKEIHFWKSVKFLITSRNHFRENVKHIITSLINRFWGNVKSNPDLKVWFVSTLGMSLIMFLLVCHITNIKIYDMNEYISDYYNAVMQVFAAILAIIVAFTTWYLEKVKLEKNEFQEYKCVIRNFIFLYISIILLSIIGLITGVAPPLGMTDSLDSLLKLMSLTIFESTLILTMPAFASLYKLSIWSMETKHERMKPRLPQLRPKF